MQGKTDLVLGLLRLGTSVNARLVTMRITPLGAAALGDHADIVKILLDAGASVDTSQAPFGSALRIAVASNYHAVVTQLLEAGAHVAG